MRKMAVLEDIHGLYAFSDTPMVTFCTCLTFATFVLHAHMVWRRMDMNGHDFCDQLQPSGASYAFGDGFKIAHGSYQENWVVKTAVDIPTLADSASVPWYINPLIESETVLVKRLVLIGRIWWNHQMLVAWDPHFFAGHVKTSPNCPSLQGKLPLFGAGLRTRLWCNASLEFVLPLVALLLATALKIFLHFREKQQAAAPKKGEVKEKELLSWKKKTGQYLIVL